MNAPHPLAQIQPRPIREIARDIIRDHEAQGRPLYFGAVPYVRAMLALNRVTENYGLEEGRSVVAYALSNLTRWKGPKAREIKAELNALIK